MSTEAETRDAIARAGLDATRIPRHVAIVMDGNGRWAKRRGLLRSRGHRRGADVVRMVTTESARLGIDRLTLYAFSSENWSRPQSEVDYLMKLLRDFLLDELATLMENDVRLEAIGRLDRLPEFVRDALFDVCARTKDNRRMILSLALSYGGRDEMVDACRAIAQRALRGELDPEELDDEVLQGHLYAPLAEDVDLVIRTAGEYRLSNFLPWQTVYAEYVGIDVLWPEVTAEDYFAALREFQNRERRFGRVEG